MTKKRICKACKQEIQRDILDANLSVCPFRGYYMRFHAKKRIISLAEKIPFVNGMLKQNGVTRLMMICMNENWSLQLMNIS